MNWGGSTPSPPDNSNPGHGMNRYGRYFPVGHLSQQVLAFRHLHTITEQLKTDVEARNTWVVYMVRGMAAVHAVTADGRCCEHCG